MGVDGSIEKEKKEAPSIHSHSPFSNRDLRYHQEDGTMNGTVNELHEHETIKSLPEYQNGITIN